MTETQIFKWAPIIDMTGTVTDAVKAAQFGDGYGQTSEDGINNRKDSWPLTFVGDTYRIKQIQDFLDWHKGAKSFFWTPPLREPGRYLASARAVNPNGGGIFTLTVTFTQTYAP